MRVLNSMGNPQGDGPKPFRYRRTAEGLELRMLQGGGWSDVRFISNGAWNRLLAVLYGQPETVYGVTGSDTSYFRGPFLENLIPQQLGDLGQLNAAYLAAVLIHEGVLHLHHGQLAGDLFRQGHAHPYEARIFLKVAS